MTTLFGGLGPNGSGMIHAVWPESYTPRSDYAAQRQMAMNAQQQLAEWAVSQHYIPTLADMNAMSNYRPPVYVPPGWVDWYANGDELH